MNRRVVPLLAALVLGTVATVTWAQTSVPLSTLPFSPGRKAGPTLYVSGQVPRTADGKDVRESVEAETRQVMENIGRVL
ncbi:MAG: RidA family protein, partial [Verrucomicrobiales bacterium]|nr:RidA family protein [Verrucomicrobiales bacterium]